MKSYPTVRIGIIGGGFGALITYIVLRFRGVAQHDIAIFAPHRSPEHTWQQLTQAIRLTYLRSESTGHFFPTDTPGLATIEAIKQRSLKPLLQAWFDRFHPTVESFLDHARALAEQTGFTQAVIQTTIGHIERREHDFLLTNTTGEVVGCAQHIIISVGHGPARLPNPVQSFRTRHPGDQRVVLSYEEKTYSPQTVLVIGSGITAATEWANILENGGAVAALSRDGFIMDQALQVPRKYFSRRGLQPYLQQPTRDRLAELKAATRGTIPPYPHWTKLFQATQASGQLGLATGALERIEPTPDGRLACQIIFADTGQQEVIVDRVISAVGFDAPCFHPLWHRLINHYSLPMADDVIITNRHSCIEKLSTQTSICAVVGPAAAWSIPCADSLSGMKIAARKIAQLIVGKETLSPKVLFQQTKALATLTLGNQLI